MKRFIKVFLYFQSISIIGINANPLIGYGVEEVTNNDFPFVAAFDDLSTDHLANHFCSGILISPDAVLTSKNCFEDKRTGRFNKDKEKISVIIGSHHLENGQKLEMSRYQSYDQWANEEKEIADAIELYHDLAVIRLKGKVENVEPAKISLMNLEDLRKNGFSNAVIAGWGVTDNQGYTKVLRKASVNILSQEDSKKHFSCYGDTNHLCTVPPEATGRRTYASVSNGDWGGPVIVNGKHIVAIHSPRPPDFVPSKEYNPNEPNFHQPLSYVKYQNFINSIKKPKSSHDASGAGPSRVPGTSSPTNTESPPRMRGSCLFAWCRRQ